MVKRYLSRICECTLCPDPSSTGFVTRSREKRNYAVIDAKITSHKNPLRLRKLESSPRACRRETTKYSYLAPGVPESMPSKVSDSSSISLYASFLAAEKQRHYVLLRSSSETWLLCQASIFTSTLYVSIFFPTGCNPFLWKEFFPLRYSIDPRSFCIQILWNLTYKSTHSK